MARTPKVVEDRREQIINAAIQVFAQKGFSKATNKDIAREAGITPGLIYYYFESKEDLLKMIIETRSPAQLITTLPQQVLEFLGKYFEAQMEKGALRRVDGVLTAQVMVGSVFGFVLRRQILRDPTALEYTHEQIAEVVSETVLQGILPR